ncbi:HAD family hydrolase [Xinfangfangia pollutisoli]|uniref:HAD family hydrolase n=1 Tax=Xinfangfangia pollutisoli TaxID=2865960 RepID=UPI001CD6733B|nr:HAD family phosphatase [Xinfangfangia pollutisoli]
MTPALKAVVFDIGNVLIRWDPVQAFLPALGDRAKVDAFLDRIHFPALNLRGDAGVPFADLAQEIADPADRAVFSTYLPNYPRSITEPIEATWALIPRLKARGLQIHAITNWSAETWPAGLAAHPRLGASFGVTVVSGHEGCIKPDPAIFARLCDRAELDPQACLFIDDSARNVAGARDFGMEAVLFTDSAALEGALQDRGLL